MFVEVLDAEGNLVSLIAAQPHFVGQSIDEFLGQTAGCARTGGDSTGHGRRTR
jgi:hypothetical protein